MQHEYEPDVINWLNKKFGTNLEFSNLQPLFEFLLLISLFEKTYFNSNIKNVNHFFKQNYLIHLNNNIKSQEKLFLTFKNRFTDNDKINEIYLMLNFRVNQNYYNFCKDTLLSTNPSESDKMKTILLIIYRFRNNLFHGTKLQSTYYEYVDIFSQFNTYLMQFIENVEIKRINK